MALSDLQRKILLIAYDNRRNRMIPDSDVSSAEVKHKVYGLPITRRGHKQFFRAQDDQYRYASVSVSVCRSFNRRVKAGLAEREGAGLRLTGKGVMWARNLMSHDPAIGQSNECG